MSVIFKISDWYFSRKALPYWCVLLLDCAIVAFSELVGFYVEEGGLNLVQEFWPVVRGVVLSIIPFVAAFYCLHTYSGILRYSSFVDLQRVTYASICGSAVVFAVSLLLEVFAPGFTAIRFPGIVGCLIMFLGSALLMGLERVLVKRLFDSFNTDGAIPVAIYGTKAGGISLAKSLTAVKDKKYSLKLFVSDGAEMNGAYLLGKKVVMNGDGIGEYLKNRGISALLVSPLKSERFRENQKMIDELTGAGVKIYMMHQAELWDGKSELTHTQFKEVDIEDLLPRQQIKIDMAAIAEQLQGKRILITGAAGSIGSEIVRQVASFAPAEMILIDQAETPMHDIRRMMASDFPGIRALTIVASITSAEYMEKIFSEHRPQYVFHAAAYKHVPMMEDNPAMAVQNNVRGTRIIADLAVKYGTAKFVMISTDKAVNPTNVMGCSKRICEIYCQSLNKAIQEGKVKGETQFVTTRFGNVLGSNGSVIPIFREQIKRGGPLTVTDPHIIRYFMLIPEACRLVLEAGTMGKGGEIFVFDMGSPVKIVDLAKRMIALSGVPGVQIEYTGLRDGEKLYEEVLSSKENTLPTPNPMIMVAKVREYEYSQACANEDRLLKLSYGYDAKEIVKAMMEIVPEYKSTNEVYKQ